MSEDPIPPPPWQGAAGRGGALPFEVEPRRTHVLSPVITVVGAAWRILLPALLVSVGGGAVVLAVVAGLALVCLAVAGGVVFLAWQRRTYSVADGALVVEAGILSRSRREVPLGRIQQIDLRRNLVQRIFGLCALHVDTASSGSGAEVVLASLDDDTANALRDLLLAHARQATRAPTGPAAPTELPGPTGPAAPIGPSQVPATGWPDTATGPGQRDRWVGGPAPHPGTVDAVPLLHMGVKDLVIAGATGSGLGVGLIFVIGGLGLAADSAIFDESTLGALATIPFALFGLAAAAVAGIVATVFADHDFTMVRIGGEIHVRRGLLEQRETVIALHRIQAVRVHENPVRRILGLCTIELQNAGSGGSTSGGEQASLADGRVRLPMVPTDRLPGLLSELLPFDTTLPPIDPAPAVARRRRLIRAAFAAACLLALGTIGSILAGGPLPFVLSVVLAVLALVLGEATFRALGSALGADLVLARSGAIIRATAVVPMARLQSVAIDRSPFQRRLDIGTLRLCVAGTGTAPEVIDVTSRRLDEMRSAALFDDTTRADERRARERVRRAARELAPPSFT